MSVYQGGEIRGLCREWSDGVPQGFGGWLLFEGRDSQRCLQKPGEMQEAGQWRQAAGLVA